jgi:regulator of chromosome condensation
MAPGRRTKRKADVLEEPTADANNVASETVTDDVSTEVAKKATTTRKGRTTKVDTTAVIKKKADTTTKVTKKTTKTITPPASQSQRGTRSRAEKETAVSPKEKIAEQVEPPAKRARSSPKSSQEKPAPKAKAAKLKAVAKPVKPVEKAKAVAKPVKPVEKAKAVAKPVAKPVVAKAAPKPKPAPKALPILTKPPTERLKVFQCGTGEYCELGLGPKPNAKIVKRPRLNELLDIEKVGVVAIAYGGMHGAVLTHDGKVYTWGVNDLGALGRMTKAKDEKLKDADAESDSEDEEEVPLNEDESTPKLVEFPEGTVITRIACSDSATIAVTETGFVYGWGTFRVGHFLTCLLSLLTNLFLVQ